MTNIEQMVKDAVARFTALSPAQQREHRYAQKKSWVVGEMMLEHPEMSREDAEALFNEVCC